MTFAPSESFSAPFETFAGPRGPTRLKPVRNPYTSRDWTTPEGFECLVREHQTAVFRTLTRLTGAGTHVQDLAQEVFLRLYRALPHFRGESMLSTYLYRITVNVGQDEWKRRRREREWIAPAPFFPDEEPVEWLENQPGSHAGGEHTQTPEQIVSSAQTQAAVDAALLQLPEHERAVLVLFHSEDCSYEGIAAALELPLNTVRTHLFRGRKRLASLVTERLASPTRPTKHDLQAEAK